LRYYFTYLGLSMALGSLLFYLCMLQQTARWQVFLVCTSITKRCGLQITVECGCRETVLVIEPILVLNLVWARSSWFGLGSVPNRLQIGRRIAAALYECAAAHMAH